MDRDNQDLIRGDNQPKRLPLLQVPDTFQPPYRLAFSLPDIPIKPKLFRTKLDTKKSYQYELSSVELNQEHQIYVDYNMGMKLDFIDRDIYLVQPPVFDGPRRNTTDRPVANNPLNKELTKEELDALKQQLITEKDKFLLSDKNHIEKVQVQDTKLTSKSIKLPSRYNVVDKVQKWGVDIKDPLAVRKLSDAENSEDEIIMTTNDSRELAQFRPTAIKQIENRFNNSKKIKVGISKSKEQSNVTAVKVFDLVPFQQQYPNKIQQVLFHDNIEDELIDNPQSRDKKLDDKEVLNNSFILHHFHDKEDKHKKYALYKIDQKEKLDEGLKESILGKRKAQSELQYALRFQHVRDYIYTQFNTAEQKNDYFIQFNENNNQVKYIQTTSKVALQKKQKVKGRTQDDEKLEVIRQVPEYLVIAARNYTTQEANQIKDTLNEIRSDFEIDLNGNMLCKDKDELKGIERQEAPALKSLFKSYNKKITEGGSSDEGEDEEQNTKMDIDKKNRNNKNSQASQNGDENKDLTEVAEAENEDEEEEDVEKEDENDEDLF